MTPAPLRKDTVALVVTTAASCVRGRPFGKCGLWFTTSPTTIRVSEVGELAARLICAERQLVVRQVSREPPAPSEPPPKPKPTPRPEPKPKPKPKRGRRR